MPKAKPDISESITKPEVETWRVAVGYVVKEDQPLVNVLTDKAAEFCASRSATCKLLTFGS